MKHEEIAEANDASAQAKACVERARASMEQGNHPSVIAWLTKALEAAPDDAWSFMRRGAARAAIHDIAGATADLERAAVALSGEGDGGRRHWCFAQLGEALRTSIRDAVIRPDEARGDADALLAKVRASIDAFTEAIREKPDSPWAYAHRGAVAMLGFWIASRAGLPALAYAEAAERDLEASLRLNDAYAWAMIFRAFLLTVAGNNEADTSVRRAFFHRAGEQLERARGADAAGRLPALRGLIELALYDRAYKQVVDMGWPQLARDPEDLVVRYCVAVATKQEQSGEGARARDATADAVVEQARNAILARRTRACAMLGGLAVLEGRFDAAAAMLADVLEYPDMDTILFIRNDPAWDAARRASGGAPDNPGLAPVVEVYKKLCAWAPGSGDAGGL